MEIITIPVKRAIGSEFAVYSYNALKLLKMIEKEIKSNDMNTLQIKDNMVI